MTDPALIASARWFRTLRGKHVHAVVPANQAAGTDWWEAACGVRVLLSDRDRHVASSATLCPQCARLLRLRAEGKP